MIDEAMERLLGFDRRRYWLENGWSIRFRVGSGQPSASRPHGLRYSFTLHDIDGRRLLGFDNAHSVPRRSAFDHRHRFRRDEKPEPYEFNGADRLICDFFDAVEAACRHENVLFAFVAEDVEETGDADETD
jgi:hypothetical protein